MQQLIPLQNINNAQGNLEVQIKVNSCHIPKDCVDDDLRKYLERIEGGDFEIISL